MLLCANRHFTGVTVTFYRCFGRFTGFRDGQGVIAVVQKAFCIISNHLSIAISMSSEWMVAENRFNYIEVLLPYAIL